MNAAGTVTRGVAALAATHGDVQAMPVSFAQRRFWVLDQLDEEAAYTLPAGLRLDGALDVSALERSLNFIVARHESLRTVFAIEGDEPVQVVLPTLLVSLPIEDLSAVPESEREQLVRERADTNANCAFDIAAGPLFRASLLRLSESSHVLLLSLHHIVADGWSMGIIFDELEAAYTAYVAGNEPALAPLPLQYPDFAVWQRRAIQGVSAARQIAYWQDRLRDLTPLELPTDFARPAIQTLNGDHRELHIEPDVAEGIRSLARRQGATPFVGFLSAFVALLHRYTGQADVVVGSLTSGRRRPEVEPLIGLFLNTLAIRTSVNPEASFLDLIRDVRESATGAYANQDVPFEHVVDAVQPTRDRSRSPIFQVAFQLLETLARDIKLPGLAASRVSGSKHSAKFELTLMLHAAPRGGLRAVLEYNADLFDGATIERMLAHYANLLAGVVRDAGAAVGRLPLMDAGEYQTVTASVNAPVEPLPEWTVPARVLQHAGQIPDAIAVGAIDGQLTYAELAARSAGVSAQLRALGVGEGHRVAVCMERTTALIVALLAVQRAGAAYVPLDPAHPADRLTYVLSDADVRVLLSDRATIARLPSVSCPTLLAHEFAAVASVAPDDVLAMPEVSGDTPAYAIYTSGSTGKPKGVVIPHRALSNFLSSMAQRPGLQAGDAVVAVTTVAFDIAGLELFLPLTTGARVELASHAVATDGLALRSLIEATTASNSGGRTLIQATPATWTLLIEAGWRGSPSVIVLCGGEAWPPNLAASLLPRCGALWNVYGPTETTIWSARYQVTTPDRLQLGEPLANTSLLVLEPTNDPAPLGVPGELWIGGDGLAIGYHNRPELTAEKFVEHPRFGRIYRTGDRARRTVQGSLVYMGRLDDQIKLRGFRIELGEIESVLAQQPGVAQSVVALRRDTAEPRLVGYVVFAPGGDDEASRIAALVEPMRRALPEYMVPSAIIAVEKLPLSPSGKVDRRALPAPPADTVLVSTEFVAPRNETEQQIAAVWGAVLGRDRVGVFDDFFDLGGHSLLAMRIVARLADVLPNRLTIGMLFAARTIAALSELVTVEQGARSEATRMDRVTPRATGEPTPLSFAQELVWLYEQLKPGTAAYHIPMARRVHGDVDARALERALNLLVARHESLRTSFVEQNGAVEQVIGENTVVSIETHDLRALDSIARSAESELLLREAALRPFDLAASSKPRVLLVRFSDDEWLMLIVVHHIVFDGASAGVFMGELAAAYAAELAGHAPHFSPLPMQLADYAAWERRELSTERLAPELAFWREELKGAPSSVELPTDFAQTANVVGPGGRVQVMLPRESAISIQAVAKALNVTPFVVLMSAFQTLLHRYSGQSDIVVGTAVAGRERSGTAELIGYLSNTLAVRGEFADGITFAELLAQLQRRILRALDHQDVPYEKIVRDLRVGLPGTEQTLFRVMFTMQDSDISVPRLGAATIEPLGVDLGAAKFDLTVSAAALADGVDLVVEYRSDLFRRDTIVRMIDHLNMLLTHGCAAPGTPVARLPIVTDAERHLMLQTWNDTDAVWPTTATIHALFAEQARNRPDAVAVEFGEQRLTYAELDRRANQIAWNLRELGVSENAMVAVCMEKSADIVAVLLGILKADAAYVPMDPAYPDDRLTFMMADSRAQVVITEQNLAARVSGGSARLLVAADCWSATPAAWDHAPPSAATASSPCYVIYTSGSTGRPKGVLIEHRNVVRLLINNRLQFEFGETDVWTVFHSFSFDFSVWEMYGALLYGGRLVVVPRDVAQQPAEYLRLLRTRGVTVLNQVPSAFYALMQEELSHASSGLALRYVIFGGEALQPGLLREWKARYRNTMLVNMFGITETTVHVTWKEIGDAEIENGSSNIGGPIPTLTLYVLDEHLQLVPFGVTGELCVGGAGVAREYLNRPELTAERFVPHPFREGERLYRSGDLGRLRPSGDIEYLGRRDSQVKLRGFRIELGEIEAVIAQHPAIASCVAMVRSDGPAGMRLVAYYVASDDRLDRGTLRAWSAARLPEFMVPAAFVAIATLPLTANGKVDRRALPAPTDKATDTGREYIAPRTPLEHDIAAVWGEVLGRERVGVDDDFFTIGGHSLLAMRVIGRLSEVLPVRLTISALFEARTVANLAAIAMQKLASQEAAATSDSDLEALLASLEDLSDEDAARLLNAELPEGA